MNTPVATLFCSILEVSGGPFSVDIEESKTVDHLKKAIVKQKPHTFVDVDPDGLNLWKVSGSLFFTFDTLTAYPHGAF